MKIIVKKEFDGKYYIGSCENLPSCYAQSESSEKLLPELRNAIGLYRKSYINRSQSLPNTYDAPVIDKKIRFNKIATSQLIKILERNSYHLESRDNDSILLINSKYPFNRILLPDTEDL